MTRMRTYESLLFCSALLCVGGFTVNQHKCSVVDRDGLLCELKGEQHERIEGDRLLRGLKKIEFSGFAGRMINLTESYFPDLQSVMIDSSLPEACSRIWTSTNVTVLVNQRRCRSIETDESNGGERDTTTPVTTTEQTNTLSSWSEVTTTLADNEDETTGLDKQTMTVWVVVSIVLSACVFLMCSCMLVFMLRKQCARRSSTNIETGSSEIIHFQTTKMD